MQIWYERSVHCTSYRTKSAIVTEKETNIYELLNALFQVVTRLLILAYVVATGAPNDEAVVKDNK